MEINVKVYFEPSGLAALKEQLAQAAESILSQLTTIGIKMSALDDAITALTAEVAKDTTVSGSVVTLINGFPAQLTAAVAAAQAAGATPAQLAAVNAAVAAMTANDTAMAAAVAAGTPAP